MNVRFSPRARGDVEDIFQYLSQRSPSGAGNVMAAIFAGVEFIAEHPYASECTDDAGIRVHVVQRYRYKIFYRVDETVEILHIRHTSRRPWMEQR